MKPEKGLDDMEEKLYDPRELFSEIGLLVTEARTPVQSVKGREEGPHCPPVSGTREHECDRHKEQCRKASDFLRLQNVLWQNKIPMRVDVLLFPNCEHGYREETVVEGAAMSSVDNFELFERWEIQLVKKRSPERMDGFVNGRSHLQAVRSYLHFSQLSSWLISTGGALPHRVVYRAYAPGESVGYAFSRLPEVHNFPSADLGDFVMRTTVAHLPRQDSLMKIVCRSPSPGIESHLRSRKVLQDEKLHSLQQFNSPGPSTSRHSFENKKDFHDMRSHSKDKMEYGKCGKEQIQQKPPIGRKLKDGKLECKPKIKSERTLPCPISNTPKRKVDQLSPTINHRQNKVYGVENEEHSDIRSVECLKSKTNLSLPSDPSVIPLQSQLAIASSTTGSQFKYPAPVTPYKSSHHKPVSLTVSTTSVITSKRLPSPKVLVTGSKRPETTLYKKRCLDLTEPDTIQENIDDFVGLKNVDDFTANDICDLVKPLSPSDLEAYLSSLSNKASKRHAVSKLEDIPTTKCSFYLDENDLESNSAGTSRIVKTGVCDKEKSANTSDSVFVNQSEIAERLSNSKQITDKKPQYVRSLFQKSLSTSEVEDELFGHSRGQSQQNVGGKVDNRESSENGTNEKLQSAESAPCPTEQAELKHNASISQQTAVNCDQPRATTLSTSQRKRTLFDQSIPCSVGGVNIAMSSLMQNLESMEIDERPCSSPLLDREVEGHLKQKLSANGQEAQVRDESAMSPVHDDSDSSSPSQKGLSLCKQLLQKEFQQNVKKEIFSSNNSTKKSLPSPDDIQSFHFMMGRSASAIFNSSTGLPSRSSPAPIKKKSCSKFDYDCTLTSVRAIKNALSCSKLTLQSEENIDTVEDPKIISTSAPASTNCLLGNFEESVLNGRIEPVGVVDGFCVEIGASGLFCPKHINLPVAAYFFQLSDDNAPSPYLGHVNLEPLGKRGYHIPRIGTVQVTLFNPNRTVVKMFVVMYDLSDMPANCQTFLRQRTVYMPADENSSEPSYLRYLIHLRFQSSKSGKVYLHTDIRLIFARDKFEFDPRVANYELRSFTESPVNPKFSPKR